MNDKSPQNGSAEQKSSDIILISEKTPPPFTVGITLSLETSKKTGEKFRFNAEVLGWARPDYLMISASYDSRLLFIHPGVKIITRYLHEGQIYGFKTRLLSKQVDPVPIWFLHFPTQIEVINLRQNSRYPILCEIRDQDGITCFTRDLSKGGASLFYRQEDTGSGKNIGDTVELNFHLPDGTPIQGLSAEIVRKYSDLGQIQLGVSFTEKSASEAEKISAYIDKLSKVYQHG